MLDNLKDSENWYLKVCLIARQFSDPVNLILAILVFAMKDCYHRC